MPPPFTPNTGPMDGSRRQSITFFPIFPSPIVRATLVVVLPSPALVGVMAVTITSFAFGTRGQTIEDRQADLAAVLTGLFELLGQDAGFLGDLGDGTQLGVVSDLEGCFHRVTVSCNAQAEACALR